MKLKNQLTLREVTGRYVIVPTGQRVREVTSIAYILSSAAYFWNYMKDHQFTKQELVDLILEHYEGFTAAKATADYRQLPQNAGGQQHPGRRSSPRAHLCAHPQMCWTISSSREACPAAGKVVMTKRERRL